MIHLIRTSLPLDIRLITILNSLQPVKRNLFTSRHDKNYKWFQYLRRVITLGRFSRFLKVFLSDIRSRRILSCSNTGGASHTHYLYDHTYTDVPLTNTYFIISVNLSSYLFLVSLAKLSQLYATILVRPLPKHIFFYVLICSVLDSWIVENIRFT